MTPRQIERQGLIDKYDDGKETIRRIDSGEIYLWRNDLGLTPSEMENYIAERSRPLTAEWVVDLDQRIKKLHASLISK